MQKCDCAYQIDSPAIRKCWRSCITNVTMAVTQGLDVLTNL